MRLGIASDHGGFRLKEKSVTRIRTSGHKVAGFGAPSLDPGDDYPSYVGSLSQMVVTHNIDRGAAACANKVKSVRSTLTHNRFFRQARGRDGA